MPKQKTKVAAPPTDAPLKFKTPRTGQNWQLETGRDKNGKPCLIFRRLS